MVHQFQLGGYNIVLDVCSGSIHVVDEVAYDAIALYEQLPRQELAQKHSAAGPAWTGGRLRPAWTTLRR